MTKIILTPGQLALLAERRGRFSATSNPGLRLMKLGLIDAVQPIPYGAFTWQINRDGERALAALQPSDAAGA